MRASRRSPLSAFSSLTGSFARVLLLTLSSAWCGCTLITDVDREKIPEPPQPTFPEVDAGPQPTEPLPDASVPDASMPLEPADAGEVSDAAPVDAAAPDAGDAGPVASGDAG
jgi:hypothetical protein